MKVRVRLDWRGKGDVKEEEGCGGWGWGELHGAHFLPSPLPLLLGDYLVN